MNAYRDQYAKLFNGGKDVVLVAISTDSVGVLASWAHDAGYPFRFASDSGGVVGRKYGAFSEKYHVDNRTLFVIGPDGRITYRAKPFRQLAAESYTALSAAVEKASGSSGG